MGSHEELSERPAQLDLWFAQLHTMENVSSCYRMLDSIHDVHVLVRLPAKPIETGKLIDI